jgi:hypothetical protein
MVRNTFDPKDLQLRRDIDIETLNKEIDALCQNMSYRLVCHLQQKVPEKKATIGYPDSLEKTFVVHCLP